MAKGTYPKVLSSSSICSYAILSFGGVFENGEQAVYDPVGRLRA